MHTFFIVLLVLTSIVALTFIVERALARGRQAGGHRRAVVALGRDLYYTLRGVEADVSLDRAEQALLAALRASDS